MLAAGLGTRLRPLTLVRAKAALPVAGTPLIRRIAARLALAGFRHVVVNLHHRPESITGCLGDGTDLGVEVRYSWEQDVLGSAGGPRLALPLLDPVFLVVNGDTLADVDLEAMLIAHARSGALITMAVVPNPAPARYGGVTIDERHNIVAFTPPTAEEASWHFVGVQVADARAFEELPRGVPVESVGWLYPRLMRERRGAVKAFPSTGAFHDIGTVSDYVATTAALSPAGDWTWAGRNCAIAPTATLRRTVLWDGVRVGPRTEMSECIVTDRVEIPEGRRFERCIVSRIEDTGVPEGGRPDGALAVTPIPAAPGTGDDATAPTIRTTAESGGGPGAS